MMYMSVFKRFTLWNVNARHIGLTLFEKNNTRYRCRFVSTIGSITETGDIGIGKVVKVLLVNTFTKETVTYQNIFNLPIVSIQIGF